MHGRPIRTSLGSDPYGSALVCTGPKTTSDSRRLSAAFEKWCFHIIVRNLKRMTIWKPTFNGVTFTVRFSTLSNHSTELKVSSNGGSICFLNFCEKGLLMYEVSLQFHESCDTHMAFILFARCVVSFIMSFQVIHIGVAMQLLQIRPCIFPLTIVQKNCNSHFS